MDEFINASNSRNGIPRITFSFCLQIKYLPYKFATSPQLIRKEPLHSLTFSCNTTRNLSVMSLSKFDHSKQISWSIVIELTSSLRRRRKRIMPRLAASITLISNESNNGISDANMVLQSRKGI